ncbi:DUF4279 domain-containing protein [Segniliparus rugosus]|uniref:DUF4279 domain-containing protein n=1 Tax=Segniliparus rugosus (strain ATCC BAA-974 / DSM 45345 / CCUG 50838 / CIP 108380 / JCM 13579 / CDC 945) TaxID=679197 RepID=E5XUE8_SEGRC|nr:DUF4279 domain-containing protein [Segniliparus rugosus]EFV12035.1 hypothetical protein HMPREF9336_03120 [Segniliparus rugosus ATCC BAA-974]
MTAKADLEGWATTIRAMVVVTGSFDPAVFTRAASLVPTRTWRAGDPRSPRLPFGCDGWKIDLGERRAAHLEAEADRLFAALSPSGDAFRAAVGSMGLSAQAAFAVFVDGRQRPSVGLRSDQIARLAELGMGLDVDVV